MKRVELFENMKELLTETVRAATRPARWLNPFATQVRQSEKEVLVVRARLRAEVARKFELDQRLSGR